MSEDFETNTFFRENKLNLRALNTFAIGHGKMYFILKVSITKILRKWRNTMFCYGSFALLVKKCTKLIGLIQR